MGRDLKPDKELEMTTKLLDMRSSILLAKVEETEDGLQRTEKRVVTVGLCFTKLGGCYCFCLEVLFACLLLSHRLY